MPQSVSLHRAHPCARPAPPLILLHGWGLGSSWWHPLVQAWAAGPVMTVDLPGYGPPPSEGLSHTFAAAAEALIDTTPPHGILCAWSLGALVALQAARMAPTHWQHLVLIGATPCFVQRPDWAHGTPAAAINTLTDHLHQDRTDALRRFAAQVLQGAPQMRALARTVAHTVAQTSTSPPSTTTLQQGLDWLCEVDLRTSLSTLTLPTLVIHGARDAVVPQAAGRWLAATLPQARLRMLDDAGHAPFLSHTADVVAAIEDSMAGITA